MNRFASDSPFGKFRSLEALVSYDSLVDLADKVGRHILDAYMGPEATEAKAFIHRPGFGTDDTETDEELHVGMHYSMVAEKAMHFGSCMAAAISLREGSPTKSAQILEQIGAIPPGMSRDRTFVKDPHALQSIVNQNLHGTFHALRAAATDVCSPAELDGIGMDKPCDWKMPGLNHSILSEQCPVCRHYGEDEKIIDRIAKGMNF